MRLLAVLIVLFLSGEVTHAQQPESAAVHPLLERTRPAASQIHLGIEIAELAQNRFRNLGKDNYTFLVGQRLMWQNTRYLGWRFLSINVELSPEHLQDESSVLFIEGNRVDLTGDLHATRLYGDYYPVDLGILFIPRWQRYLLTVSPVIGSGLGYTRNAFTNTRFQEHYDLKALTLSLHARLSVVVLGALFIESPVLDMYTYLIKNRSPRGTIGDTEITRPESVGMHGFFNLGVIIPLSR